MSIRKSENLHIRVTEEQKALLVKVSTMLGMDTSAFILQNSLREARKELQAIDQLSLSDHDSAVFLDALVDPPSPNANLKAAFDKYKDIFN